jgi:lipoprotein NlpI
MSWPPAMLGTVLLAAMLAVAAPASAADDADICAKGLTEDAIAACTRVIKSGKWKGRGLAWAFANRGNGYVEKGQNDSALADFNEAIRLDPKLAKSYNNRGIVWYAKGEDDRAVADYNEAIRLDPKHANAYNNRGIVWHAKGEDDRALADYNEAIGRDPKSDHAYFNRSATRLYQGNEAGALADISQASELNPRKAYHAIWLDLIGQRNGVPSRLAEATARLDMTVWPAPIIRMMLGQLTSEAAVAAADDPDAFRKHGHVCEVNFFAGELALRRGNRQKATELFRMAAGDCPKTFVQYDAARAELKALGETP